MTKSHLPVKQICFQSIISNLTSNRNELWKTVSLTRFQKPQLQSFSIFFKLIHPCLLLYLLCYKPSFIKHFEQLFLYFTQLCGSLHCPNFGKFYDSAPLKLLIKSFSFQYKLEGGLHQRWLIIRYFHYSIGRWVYNCREAYKWGGQGQWCLKVAVYVFSLIYKICIFNAFFQGSNPILYICKHKLGC